MLIAYTNNMCQYYNKHLIKSGSVHVLDDHEFIFKIFDSFGSYVYDSQIYSLLCYELLAN